MVHRWEAMTFLHWRYEPGEVQRLLPNYLTAETFDGSAWVGLTPFRITIRAPGALPFSPVPTTPETNVRTYVIGPDGKRGIWFFSLDIGFAPAALVGRGAYFLPYLAGDLSIAESANVIRYEGRRRWPQRAASYRIVIERGEPYANSELTELDHFLTALWAVYMHYGPAPAAVFAEHQPWPVCRASVDELHETVVESAGLPPPRGEPLAHYSPGVEVRISLPHLLCGGAS
jgi:uncharacterized protein YqjF (DUF2071 family)